MYFEVLLEFGLFAKRAIAHFTSIWFNTRMNTLVLDQLALPNETLFTKRTFVWFNSCMRYFVPRSIRVMSKRLVAVLAFPRFRSGMSTHVVLKMVLSLKRLPTHIALEWQRFGMDQHVNLQITLPLEAPSADGTGKRLLIVVHQHMLLQCRNRSERLCANLAAIRSLIVMSTFMLDRRVSTPKLSTTDGTRCFSVSMNSIPVPIQ